MRLVIVESPYASTPEETARNERYARVCMADCLARGEAPFASHLLYTQPGVLKDSVPAERALGIEAGLAWGAKADATVVYIDFGVSPGMRKGIERAHATGRLVEARLVHPASLARLTVGPELEARSSQLTASASGSAASSAHRGYPSCEGSPGEGLDDAGRSSSNPCVFIDYTNHRGERRIRRIEPRHLWFGATQWHPEPQWLLSAFDFDKGEERDFAMTSVTRWLEERYVRFGQGTSR